MFFSLKTTFRKLALLLSSGEKWEKGWHVLCGVPYKELVSITGLVFKEKNIGRWIKSKSKILRNASHHGQNPSGQNYTGDNNRNTNYIQYIQ
jgi:hypothetical protein